jgi:hypothetical protein
MSSDFAIAPTLTLPSATSRTKPSYLIVLESSSFLPSKKTSAAPARRFITFDKPSLLNGFVEVKGFWTELSEEIISATFSDVISNIPKEEVVELMIPFHKIDYMKSLVFKQK